MPVWCGAWVRAKQVVTSWPEEFIAPGPTDPLDCQCGRRIETRRPDPDRSLKHLAKLGTPCEVEGCLRLGRGMPFERFSAPQGWRLRSFWRISNDADPLRLTFSDTFEVHCVQSRDPRRRS
jgi:hypothetical protein